MLFQLALNIRQLTVKNIYAMAPAFWDIFIYFLFFGFLFSELLQHMKFFGKETRELKRGNKFGWALGLIMAFGLAYLIPLSKMFTNPLFLLFIAAIGAIMIWRLLDWAFDKRASEEEPRKHVIATASIAILLGILFFGVLLSLARVRAVGAIATAINWLFWPALMFTLFAGLMWALSKKTRGPSTEQVERGFERIEQRLNKGFEGVTQNIGHVQENVTYIRGAVDDLTSVVNTLLGHLRNWEQRLEAVDLNVQDIYHNVQSGLALTKAQQDFLTQWKEEWAVFSDFVGKNFAKVGRGLGKVTGDVQRVLTEFTPLKTNQQNLLTEFGEMRKVQEDLNRRIAALPPQVQVQLRVGAGEIGRDVEDARSLLESQVAETQRAIDQLTDIVSKTELPLLQDIDKRMGMNQKETLGKIAEVEKLLARVAKEGAKEETLRALVPLVRTIHEWINTNRTALENLKDVGPNMQELLKGMTELLARTKNITIEVRKRKDDARARQVSVVKAIEAQERIIVTTVEGGKRMMLDYTKIQKDLGRLKGVIIYFERLDESKLADALPMIGAAITMISKLKQDLVETSEDVQKQQAFIKAQGRPEELVNVEGALQNLTLMMSQTAELDAKLHALGDAIKIKNEQQIQTALVAIKNGRFSEKLPFDALEVEQEILAALKKSGKKR